jgi:hypothetical protein
MNNEIENDFNFAWSHNHLQVFEEKHVDLIPSFIKKNLRLYYCFFDVLKSFPRFFTKESCLKVVYNQI